MKLSERYELTKDKYQWILTEWTDGEDKDGNPKRKSNNSYHSTLQQVASYVVDNDVVEFLDDYISKSNAIKDEISSTLMTSLNKDKSNEH